MSRGGEHPVAGGIGERWVAVVAHALRDGEGPLIWGLPAAVYPCMLRAGAGVVTAEAGPARPGLAGLGVFEGEVVRLAGGIAEATGGRLKIPHMGWNEAEPEADHRGLLSATAQHFYFVHSFVVIPRDRSVVAATTEYGSVRFVSAVSRENVFACQFHPEKSQRAGIALLERFAAS